MKKKVAVIAVNPVNGMGLFQYLEAFYENDVLYKTYAVSDNKEIKTNSGITLIVDDVIANLKGNEDEYDALVFSCGDAIPKLNENGDKQFNRDMMTVIQAFYDKGKILVGHCAAAMLFDTLGIAENRKVAVHPYGKSLIQKAKATDSKIEIDSVFYTAQTESAIGALIPELLKVLQ